MFSTRSLAKSLALAAGLATLLFSAMPARAAVWIPGHYGPGGGWIPGHWAPGPGGPGPGPYYGGPPGGHRVWVPGWRGPAGYWHPGHWRWEP